MSWTRRVDLDHGKIQGMPGGDPEAPQLELDEDGTITWSGAPGDQFSFMTVVCDDDDADHVLAFGQACYLAGLRTAEAWETITPETLLEPGNQIRDPDGTEIESMDFQRPIRLGDGQEPRRVVLNGWEVKRR